MKSKRAGHVSGTGCVGHFGLRLDKLDLLVWKWQL